MREVQKETTARLLLESAEELFIAQGYAQTTIEQIAGNAGASRATFYLHFEKKSDTVLALLDQAVPETVRFYERLNAIWPPTENQLAGWIDDALDFYKRHYPMLEVFRQAAAGDPGMSHYQASESAKFADILDRYMAGWPEDGQNEARLRLSILVVQLTNITMGWLNGMWDVDRPTITRILVDTWTAGLRLPSKH